MDEAFGDIGPEVIGRKSIAQPGEKSGSFDDPPVLRPAGVIVGCVVAMLAALGIVGGLLWMVNEPPERPALNTSLEKP